MDLPLPIETSRLRLRPFVTGDLAALHAVQSRAAVVALAFGTYDLHRVYGRLEARNLASARVLEKLG